MDTDALVEQEAHRVTAVLLLRFRRDLAEIGCYPLKVQDKMLGQLEGALKNYLLIERGWPGDAAVNMAVTYCQTIKFALSPPKRDEVIQ